MSNMKELFYEIQVRYRAGMDPATIARSLNIPIEQVLGAIDIIIGEKNASC